MAHDVFGITGTTLAGSFEVEGAVAEGGFGVVYRAHHRGFRAPVALKCIGAPSGMTDAQRDAFLTQFRKEAEILFRLSAAIPEVVRPLHIDVTTLPDGRFVPFLALEWLTGETLADYLDRRRDEAAPALGLEAAMDILQPIAAALARAHRFAGPDGVESIVHRDLKPANIFLTNVAGDEGVKILDFGIAKVKKLVTERHDTGKSLLGETSAFTPGFAAPEQWQPKRFGPTGTYTDVWGLALTLVETLSGLPPIDGELLVMREMALDEARRPTPRSLGVTVPDRAEKAFLRALAVDPRKRTRRIEELWTELESALGLPASLFLLEATREPSRSSPRLKPPAQGAPASQRPAAPTTPPSSQRAYAMTMPSPDHARAADAPASEPGGGAADGLAEAPILDLEIPDISALAGKAKARPPPPPVRIPSLEAKAAAVATEAPRTPPALDDDDLGGSLESVPLAVDPVRSTRPRPRPSFASTAELYRPTPAPAPTPSLAEPGALIAIGLVGAAAERYLGSATGQPYMIGPIRLAWIAGVVALVGAAWMVSRLLSRPSS